MERLCALHHHPQNAFPIIHVAGTNGKGSVCTKIAAALQAEGYKTGLYTSPHILTFRERIRVDGEMISEEELASLFIEDQATYFEMAYSSRLQEPVTDCRSKSCNTRIRKMYKVEI